MMRPTGTFLIIAIVAAGPGLAGTRSQPAGSIEGRTVDQTGAPLTGVTVELARGGAVIASTVSAENGTFLFDPVPAGAAQITCRLINFATVRRTVDVVADQRASIEVTLPLSLNADVTVTSARTFRNLADLPDPTQSLIGVAAAASQGAVTAAQLETRPIMRSGEVLETVPGVIISQHSGEGKANQYYLRGFNLDHGTDFATTVDGVPVNMPTHAHGHGYSDLGFVIPELVSGVQFRKGPYYVEDGDFSAAGAATIRYVNEVEQPFVHVGAGMDGWGRVLAAASPTVGRGRMLAALELNHNDGPWTRPDNYRRGNGVLRYGRGDAQGGFSLTGMGYWADWDATDQAPLRAITDGTLPRFAGVDTSDGGRTHRVSVAADWQHGGSGTATRANAFVMSYGLDLFSNFTYFLDDPVNGDQFEQADGRWIYGGRLIRRRLGRWGSRPVESALGVEIRHDDIGTVGLYHTRDRARLATVRQDAVRQTSLAAFTKSETEWTPHVRTTLGVRGDLYRFRVRSDLAGNSGTEWDALVSPKVLAAFGPWEGTELYASAGLGFHSNDARGATIAIDPSTNEPAQGVTPLVRARGVEAGVRTVRLRGIQSTLALWVLGLDSELVFVGDAGTTEASRPSRRYGLEWNTYARLGSAVTLDGDLSLSRAHFTDDEPAGAFIPGAVARVVSFGISLAPPAPIFGSIRVRHFGPRPLIEDASVNSEPTTLLNLQAGYRVGRARLVLDLFNVLNATDSDIDYFYTSRLPGEPGDGIEDVHTHPALPRTARVALTIDF